MITREDVADLRVGDVVEYAGHPALKGAKVIGPLVQSLGDLIVGGYLVRYGSEDPPGDAWGDLTLTVISRAKPPLYVNSDKTEPDPGDVVRDADSDDPLALFVYVPDPGEGSDDPWPWLCTDSDWKARRGLPTRLRLLVDGTTGQVVP